MEETLKRAVVATKVLFQGQLHTPSLQLIPCNHNILIKGNQGSATSLSANGKVIASNPEAS
jgi:hypothetical protein